MGMASAEAQFHVLAVDDSLIDRKLIERLLKTSSYQVTTVDSGSKALEFLGWNGEEIDHSNKPFVSPKDHQVVEVNLVITDYCMPGMTGYDLLKKMKESSFLRNIPVVIMSSENVPSRINRCLEEGAEEFFLKPVRLSDVSKLKPHMMKAKTKDDDDDDDDQQQPDQDLDQTHENQESASSSDEEEKASDQSQLQTTETEQTGQESNNSSNNNNNGKRKSIDEGVSPDRTRQRYSGFTVMSN